MPGRWEAGGRAKSLGDDDGSWVLCIWQLSIHAITREGRLGAESRLGFCSKVYAVGHVTTTFSCQSSGWELSTEEPAENVLAAPFCGACIRAWRQRCTHPRPGLHVEKTILGLTELWLADRGTSPFCYITAETEAPRKRFA